MSASFYRSWYSFDRRIDLMAVLGLDIGTGGSRAVLVGDDGRLLASATAAHDPFASPETGWAEQHPADWWRAAQQAIQELLSAAPVAPSTVQAVGLSGQMHGAVLLDEAGEVVRPAIIWCDQRSDAECRALTARIGADRLIEWVSNPALTGFTLPKLLWVRDHEPALWERVRTVLLPKDFVRWQLTGERATDVADASGTLLFDVAHRCWSAAMLKAVDLPEDLLPVVYEGPAITGRVCAAGAQATGLLVGTPVVAGGGDQAAGAVGMGVVRPGTVSATIGTSGVVFATTDRPAMDGHGRVHTFCHAVPDRWHVMGVTQGAGLSLRWFKETFGVGELIDGADGDSYDRLCATAAGAPVGSDGVMWAPYLMGERTPHLNPHARAALVGLSASHSRAHVSRALLEGVAFSLRDSLTIIDEMGLSTRRVRLGGGGARSALWRQIQADVYKHPVELLEAEEGAAYGAALLAGVGTGLWDSVDQASEAVVRVAETLNPIPEHTVTLDRQYEQFRRLYPALHP